MNYRSSIAALLVLSSSCVSAAATTDMSGFPICPTMKQYADPELYLQSTEKKCSSNVYTISEYFNTERLAQEVVVSSLPAI
jgi:hypothetical protein